MRNLDELFSRTLTKDQLVTYLVSIVESLVNLEESSVDFENIFLNKKQIFLDHFSNRLIFMPAPIIDNNFEKVSMSEFLRELLSGVVYDENDDLSFFIRLHNYLASTPTLRLQEFKQKLNELSGGKMEAVQEHFYSPGKMTSAPEATLRFGVCDDRPDKMDENDGTSVLAAYGEEEEEGTTALGVGNAFLPKPFLVEVATREKIVVTKESFTIGRDPNQADYASKNKAVGRVHAEVSTLGGEYFLIDKQSRNGSYLNGVKLVPNEKMKIKHDDCIRLGNQEFAFKLF